MSKVIQPYVVTQLYTVEGHMRFTRIETYSVAIAYKVRGCTGFRNAHYAVVTVRIKQKLSLVCGGRPTAPAVASYDIKLVYKQYIATAKVTLARLQDQRLLE